MGIGEARRTLVLDSEVLAAAARSIGIMDHAALVAHLGMEVTHPPSMILVAVVLLRLPVTLKSVLRVVEDDIGDGETDPGRSASAYVRDSLRP